MNTLEIIATGLPILGILSILVLLDSGYAYLVHDASARINYGLQVALGVLTFPLRPRRYTYTPQHLAA